jgi:hypothetical protein
MECRRSSYLRECLLDDFGLFLELTVESKPWGKPLPPALIIAKALKFKCSKCSNSTLGEKVYRLHVKVMM